MKVGRKNLKFIINSIMINCKILLMKQMKLLKIKKLNLFPKEFKTPKVNFLK